MTACDWRTDNLSEQPHSQTLTNDETAKFPFFISYLFIFLESLLGWAANFTILSFIVKYIKETIGTERDCVRVGKGLIQLK